MAERIAIVTDSTCDLPEEQVKAAGIHSVPLSIFFGDKEYLDGKDLTSEGFYEKLKSSPHFPTTAQPAPGKFLTLFQRLQEEGFTHVLCIHISRKFSATAQSATVAANMLPQLKIEVIDSRICCWALGSLALYAQRLVRQGLDFQTVINKLNKQIPKSAAFFSVDSLAALERGGRIGKARALIGKYLGIRPVMCIREGFGEIEVIQTVRSPEAASEAMAKLAARHVQEYGLAQNAVVLYTVIKEYPQILLSALKKESANFGDLPEGRIGGVIGSHLGPTGWGITLC